MTLNEITTHTLAVPGATLSYDVRPGGPPDATPSLPDRLANGRGRLRHPGEPLHRVVT